MISVSAFVAFERGDHQQESFLPGEQADGDLRFRRRSLEKPGSRNTSPWLASQQSVDTS